MPDEFKLINATKETACRTAEAEAIRAKTGGTVPLAYDFNNDKGFADAIAAIPSGGITPSGSQTFTENGTYDVTAIAEAIINVSGGGLPNVRKFTVVTDSTLGTYGGISFPVIKSGRANYLIMNTDATHLNGSDRHVRAIGLCIDYNYSTTKQAIGIARYDMASGSAISPSTTITDGVLTMLGGSVYHMEQTYTLDVYEVIW